MIICFNCSRETKSKIDTLLTSGQYNDINELISGAIETLAVLSTEIINKGAIIIDDFEEAVSDGSVSRIVEETGQTRKNHRGTLMKASHGIPEIFELAEDYSESITLAELPVDNFKDVTLIPPQDWTFGQHNKLLPVKASCRALVNLLQKQPEGIKLEEAADFIAQKAVELGRFLKDIDKRLGNKKNEAYCTAFPVTSQKEERAILRYSTQFVGNITKNGQLTGALYDLKLINHIPGEINVISLTELGWQLGLLKNPLLDQDVVKSQSRFHSEEVEHLIRHILSSVPRERQAYMSIIGLISNNIDDPEGMDSRLMEIADAIVKNQYKLSFIRTQRSGAISRMSDLGLIERIKDGIRVKYSVTEMGKRFADSCPRR